MTRPSFTSLLLALTLLTSLHAQEAGRSEGFIESNWGLANITGIVISDNNAVFPGTSVLAGGRHFISRCGFLEVQGGLAFPSVLTAKVGGWQKVGLRMESVHRNSGVSPPRVPADRRTDGTVQPGPQ